MATEVYLDFYSPRHGHADRYTFKFDKNEIHANMDGLKNARCIRDEGGRHIWSGYENDNGNPLLNILENDRIYPPNIFLEAIIFAWDSWRCGDLSDRQLESELKLLIDWVNIVSKNKPDSKFWTSQF